MAASLGTDQASVDRVTAAMLADLFTGGDFSVNLDGTAPLLGPSERSHMSDVGGLVRTLALVEAAALVTLLVTWRRLRAERPRRGRLLMRAASGIGLLAIILGAFFAVSFDAAFAAFHSLFFKPGTWQFGPDSNLIRVFPEPFWFETSLLAGVAIVASAALAVYLGRRDLRRLPGDA